MLIGEAFEPSGAGKQVSCTDEADWMGPLANTESSLCHKHQAGPHFHKFINCCLILDGFFFFFFLGPTTPWGQLLTGPCGLGLCLWKTILSVSHLCQGAVKKKENLACYYCASAGHKYMTATVTLCLCCLNTEKQKTGAGKTSRITQPSLLNKQGIKFTSIILGMLAKAPAKKPSGKLLPVGHCTCKNVFSCRAVGRHNEGQLIHICSLGQPPSYCPPDGSLPLLL